MRVNNLSLEKICRQLARKKPTPGGGVTAAVAGALAASLVAKTINFSLGKEECESVQKELKKMAKENQALIKEFQVLADQDILVYQDFLKDKGSPERIRKLIRVPLEVARLALQVLEMADFLAEKGNQNLVADARCALELGTASFYAGLETVRVNLPHLAGLDFEDEVRDQIEDFLEKAKSLLG